MDASHLNNRLQKYWTDEVSENERSDHKKVQT